MNRNIPYGYEIADGKTKVNAKESNVVKEIYEMYAQGASYKSIAAELTAQGVRYSPDKPKWNKNMVARILQNDRYLGTKKFPQIIHEELSQAVKLMAKPYTHTECAEIKAIKPLLICAECGGEVKRRVKADGNERWYCENVTDHIALALTDELILEQVMEHPLPMCEEQVQPNLTSHEIVKLENELNQMWDVASVDELQEMILHIAHLKYELCPDVTVFTDIEGDVIRLARFIRQIPLKHMDVCEIEYITEVRNE